MTDGTKPIDTEHLAAVMQALGSPVRLQLLRLLRDPHTLGDIRLSPRRAEQGQQPTRPMSVANVRKHVAQLAQIGVVRSRRIVRDGRTTDHYEVNRPQVFALTEELRTLGQLPGSNVLDGTMPGPPPAPPRPPAGPHLVLVRGLGEGRVFELGGGGRQAWTLGRAEDADVRLEYDGFVSLANSRVVRDGKGFMVEDVATSRNGTTVNWQPVPRGGRVPVQAGDVIGVGRSLLLFRSP